VKNSIRGKRGQRFLKEMLAVLDAMPVKRLIAHELATDGHESLDGYYDWDKNPEPGDIGVVYCEMGAIVGGDELINPSTGKPIRVGEVCAIGSVGKARGVDMSPLNPEDTEGVAAFFDIADPLAREIFYLNDEYNCQETPEQRWVRMRAWVASAIKEEPANA
jgi:hypothetical protein